MRWSASLVSTESVPSEDLCLPARLWRLLLLAAPLPLCLPLVGWCVVGPLSKFGLDRDPEQEPLPGEQVLPVRIPVRQQHANWPVRSVNKCSPRRPPMNRADVRSAGNTLRQLATCQELVEGRGVLVSRREAPHADVLLSGGGVPRPPTDCGKLPENGDLASVGIGSIPHSVGYPCPHMPHKVWHFGRIRRNYRKTRMLRTRSRPADDFKARKRRPPRVHTSVRVPDRERSIGRRPSLHKESTGLSTRRASDCGVERIQSIIQCSSEGPVPV